MQGLSFCSVKGIMEAFELSAFGVLQYLILYAYLNM